MDNRISVWDDGKALKVDIGDSFITVKTYNSVPLNYTPAAAAKSLHYTPKSG